MGARKKTIHLLFLPFFKLTGVDFYSVIVNRSKANYVFIEVYTNALVETWSYRFHGDDHVP